MSEEVLEKVTDRAFGLSQAIEDCTSREEVNKVLDAHSFGDFPDWIDAATIVQTIKFLQHLRGDFIDQIVDWLIDQQEVRKHWSYDDGAIISEGTKEAIFLINEVVESLETELRTRLTIGGASRKVLADTRERVAKLQAACSLLLSLIKPMTPNAVVTNYSKVREFTVIDEVEI